MNRRPILPRLLDQFQKGFLILVLVFGTLHYVYGYLIHRIDHHLSDLLTSVESPGIGLYSAPFRIATGDRVPRTLLSGLLTSRPPAGRMFHGHGILVVSGLPGDVPPPYPSAPWNAMKRFVVTFGPDAETILSIAESDPDGILPGPTLDHLWLPPTFLGTVAGNSLAEYRPIPLSDISQAMQKTLIVSEDRRFYLEPAIDFLGIVRAAWDDIKAARFREGGSTLTQQVVKNLFLTRKKTLYRKAVEAVYALRLIRLRTPDQILSLYLNHIDWGGTDHTRIIGIEAASERYFGHPARYLNYRESALLAAILRAPTRNAPFRDPGRAMQVRNVILGELYRQNLLSKKEFSFDVRSPLGVSRDAFRNTRPGPYFADWASRIVRNDPDMSGSGQKPAALATTMDPVLSSRLDSIVPRILHRLEKGYRLHRGDMDAHLEAAVVVMDPTNGNVLAMSGGRGFDTSPFNRAVRSYRQPASLFKIVPYLVALSPVQDGPPRATLSTWLSNDPISLKAGGLNWHPKNASEVTSQRLLLEEAFIHSLNIPLLHLEPLLPPKKLVRTARELGFETPSADRLPASWPLGVIPQTPLEVASAYSAVANGGWAVSPQAFPQPPDTVAYRSRILDPGAVYLVNHLLRETVRRGTGHALTRWVGDESGWGGKTGTSNEGRDGWFVAVSPQRVVVAWVGFDDNRPTHRLGAQLAIPIVGPFLSSTLPHVTPLPAPPDIIWDPIDPDTGLVASAACARSVLSLPYLPGSAPPPEGCGAPPAPNHFLQSIGSFLQHLF